MSLQKDNNRPRPLRPPEPVRDYHKSLNRQEPDPRTDAWLDHCRRAAGDFSYFASFMCGFRVHDGQLAVVQSMDQQDYGVLAASNGWGKTLLFALLTLWASFGKRWAPQGWETYRSVVLGPEMKQALLTHFEIDSIRKNKHEGQKWCGHRPCPDGLGCVDATIHPFRLAPWLIPYKTPDTHLAYRWKHNGAHLHFESAQERASSIEGWRLNLIIYDEARLELHLSHIVDQVLLARGVRAPGMRILLASTPLADSYELLEYFNKGQRHDGNWWSRSGAIDENVFLSPEQVKKVHDNLDPRIRDQVLKGRWIEPPDSYFIRERVEECFDSAPPPEDISDYRGKALNGHQYAGGLDAAVAEGGDESVVTVWDIAVVPHRVVLQKVFPKATPLTKVVGYCDILIQDFGCVIGFDASGPLGVELQHQVSHDPTSYVPIKFTGGNLKSSTASINKVEALANFRHFVNNKLWSSPNLPELRAEILGYKVKDQALRKDRLMAQVYAAWVAKDYLGLSTEGLSLPEGGNPYVGHGTRYGSSGRPEWQGKSDLQRKWLRMVEEHELRETIRRALEEE